MLEETAMACFNIAFPIEYHVCDRANMGTVVDRIDDQHSGTTQKSLCVLCTTL